MSLSPNEKIQMVFSKIHDITCIYSIDNGERFELVIIDDKTIKMTKEVFWDVMDMLLTIENPTIKDFIECKTLMEL